MTPDPSTQLTNLHYFFSTAPQVIGAMLAISGAFIVFKLDSLRKELDIAIDTMVESLFDNVIEVKSEFRWLNIEFDTNIITICKYSQDYKPLRKVIEDVVNILQKTVYSGDVIRNIKNDNNIVFFTRLYAITHCLSFLAREYDVSKFIKRTKFVFCVNGIIFILLLGFFFAIPAISSAKQPLIYWTSLAVGWIITSFSFISIIRFMIVSLTNRNKRQEKATEELYSHTSKP